MRSLLLLCCTENTGYRLKASLSLLPLQRNVKQPSIVRVLAWLRIAGFRPHQSTSAPARIRTKVGRRRTREGQGGIQFDDYENIINHNVNMRTVAPGGRWQQQQRTAWQDGRVRASCMHRSLCLLVFML